MKILLSRFLRRRRGYALVMVLVFAAISTMALAAIMMRSATDSNLTRRNNNYFDAVEASEADTEKVLSALSADFLNSGAATVQGNMANYHAKVPVAGENGWWKRFNFKDTHGNKNATEVDLLVSWNTNTAMPLISQYQGLSGYGAVYRITSIAQNLEGGNNIAAAVQQDLQLATVPVFQFAIFYNLDMEMCPGANMVVGGRVHSNGNIYLQPDGSQLTFLNDVTAAQNIIAGKSPNDPTLRSPGTILFDSSHDSGVSTLNLPIGTNNSPSAVHAIIEIPPSGESPNSPMGQQRLYNQADLIVLTYNDHVDVHGGNTVNGNGATVPWKQAQNFVNTNASFYDTREGKTIKATQIDVGALTQWSYTNKNVKAVQILYVADLRTQSGSTEPAVRLVDGQFLPTNGLTVATQDPLYVQGNYNVANSALGTTNTSLSAPAALLADSINVLSGSWQDSNSTKSLSSRNATDTTVNAAFLAGIVPSGGGYYSGGVENFPRFLENWSGHTFYYNGSMVVMFPSQIATAPWKGTGSTWNIYNAPTRSWHFDLNFTNPTRLPPGTPAVRVAIRGAWAIIPAN